MRLAFTFLIAALLHLQVFADAPKTYPQVGVTEHHLDNGMKVLIQNNQLEEGEVYIRIYSHGGYAQEASNKDKASAFISFNALLESGLGHEGTSDQVSKALYEHSAELSVYVLPSSKGIEIKVPTECFASFIAYLSPVFNTPKITPEGYRSAVRAATGNVENKSVKNKYNMIAKTYELYFGEDHFSTQSPGKAMRNVDMEAAQAFVNKAFNEENPFTIVVVGDIDADKALKALNQHLPKKQYQQKAAAHQQHPINVTTPKIITMPGSDHKEPVSSITYGIKLDPNGKELAIFETSLRIIENRLEEKLSKMVGRKGFRVSFDFPYYPEVSLSWVQIKFNVHGPLEQPTLAAIHHQLEDLAQNGPSREEIEKVTNSLRRGGQLLKNDNYFWVTLIGDYSLWGWDLNHISMRISQNNTIAPSEVQEFLSKAIALNAPITILME
jgi:zinc protease